jgi:hypothetical protein
MARPDSASDLAASPPIARINLTQPRRTNFKVPELDPRSS